MKAETKSKGWTKAVSMKRNEILVVSRERSRKSEKGPWLALHKYSLKFAGGQDKAVGCALTSPFRPSCHQEPDNWELFVIGVFGQ